MRHGLSGLDFGCSAEQCNQGETAISQMMTVWQSGIDKTSDISFHHTFTPVVRAVQAKYEEINRGLYIELWNSKCCQIAALGKQAQAITSQMLNWLKLPKLPGVEINANPDSPWDGVTKLASLVKWSIIGLVGLWAYSEFLRPRPERYRPYY